MNDTVVKVTALSKTFKDFWGRPKAKAVNEVDFDVAEGEVFGLLGPNGSGKSTTIKMLLGLLYPTQGRISVFNRPPDDVETKKRIGYLPEESYLYKYLTAEETLDFFGALFNLSTAERQNRTEQLLKMVGLTHAAKRQIGEFSKGMARRIGLAQAMINDPDLLILDEPTSGLDPLGCREIKDLILFLKSKGKTVIISSHLLADVEDVCDRVVILYGGKVRAGGKLESLLTVSDESRITMPGLSPPETEMLMKILKENLNGDKFIFDHPRRSLEEFFLDVVQMAKIENVETFGASGSGKIAEYLIHDKSKKDLLEMLSAKKEIPEKEEEKNNKSQDLHLQNELKSAEILRSLNSKTSGENIPHENENKRLSEKQSDKIIQIELDEADKKLSGILNKKQ